MAVFVMAATVTYSAGHGLHTVCHDNNTMQESRAVASEPRDVAAVVFGLKFADNTRYKFKSSQASKAKLQSSKLTRAKQFNAKWPF